MCLITKIKWKWIKMTAFKGEIDASTIMDEDPSS